VDEPKRQQQRYDCRLDLEYSIGADTRAAVIQNISLGGLYAEAADRPAYGARLRLRFRLPSQKDPVDVGGTVRWADANGFGVQFDGLRARDVYALSKLAPRNGPLD
jgi:hypothetical protein